MCDSVLWHNSNLSLLSLLLQYVYTDLSHFTNKMQLNRPSLISEMTVYRPAIIAGFLVMLVQPVWGQRPPLTTGLHAVQQARKWDGCSAERDITSPLLEMTKTKLLISHKTTLLLAGYSPLKRVIKRRESGMMVTDWLTEELKRGRKIIVLLF